jgi:formamidopyrimidine-DNA glycosylase
LERRVAGQALEAVKLSSPFVLRSFDPPLAATFGQTVRGVRRIGKRIVLDLGNELFIVVHLMIAGRLHWRGPGEKKKPQGVIATFEFSAGTLYFTEAGTRKRASLTVVRGESALAALDPGGIDVMDAPFERFHEALVSGNHTLKRALTDPHKFSGIGNAYSDEILHAAKLSPFKIASKLTPDEVSRLHTALHSVLTDAVGRSVGPKAATLKGEKRSGLQVHARAGLPCPVCGDTVRSVSFADKHFEYCPTCQTEGRELADRRLSKLLK